MAKFITIYQVTDNEDPVLYESFFTNLKDAKAYAEEECDNPLGPFEHEIELTKIGICKALKDIPWRLKLI